MRRYYGGVNLVASRDAERIRARETLLRVAQVADLWGQANAELVRTEPSRVLCEPTSRHQEKSAARRLHAWLKAGAGTLADIYVIDDRVEVDKSGSNKFVDDISWLRKYAHSKSRQTRPLSLSTLSRQIKLLRIHLYLEFSTPFPRAASAFDRAFVSRRGL